MTTSGTILTVDDVVQSIRQALNPSHLAVCEAAGILMDNDDVITRDSLVNVIGVPPEDEHRIAQRIYVIRDTVLDSGWYDYMTKSSEYDARLEELMENIDDIVDPDSALFNELKYIWTDYERRENLAKSVIWDEFLEQLNSYDVYLLVAGYGNRVYHQPNFWEFYQWKTETSVVHLKMVEGSMRFYQETDISLPSGQDPDRLALDAQARTRALTSGSARTEVCQICGSGFENQTELAKHYNREHAGRLEED